MIIENIGDGYYAGVMRGFDLIVVRQDRMEIIKRLSEIAFF